MYREARYGAAVPGFSVSIDPTLPFRGAPRGHLLRGAPLRTLSPAKRVERRSCREEPACPAGAMRVLRPDTWVPPYRQVRLTERRGRRPQRPYSAKRCHSEPVTVSLAWESVPRRGSAALQGPLCEGAVGAADWGREGAVLCLSLRQRFALPLRGRQGETDRRTGLRYIFPAPAGETTAAGKIFLKNFKKPLYKSERIWYYTNANDNC